ncbi:MAG: SurA N-terminal domain-containing protein [Deltaproteobacteria bacterium]|nr:SurA N-terminal domain-containing protein [Deltaproteobacteria bacterium]RLB88010.1 MAG: hypothetical protein DRH50_15905 [Deltaproteobacteria bacterium]
MGKKKAFLAIIISLWFASGTGRASAEVVDRIVAIVNNDTITLSELNEELEPYAEQIRESHYTPEQKRKALFKLRQEILDRMIDQKLTDQESKKLGISIRESEVDKTIEEIKHQYFYTDEELRGVLAEEGLTLEEYRARIKEQLLQIKLVNIEVKSKIAITAKEIQDYYQRHKNEYQSRKKYHLRTILIGVPSSATPDQKLSALNRIEAVVAEFKKGASFENLARRYSEDITAADGGDLGLFSLRELSPQFQQAVRKMKEGEISPVLETPHGYQVLMLQKVIELPGKTLKEARIEIQEKLFRNMVEKKYKAWLKSLRERSYIKIIQ